MRVDQTSAERRLWQALRRRLDLRQTHFRRQFAIGPYVVDFVCLAARLVVEVDGPSHATDLAERRDRVRATYLEGEGFRILRFCDGEVFEQIDAVLDTIDAALAETTATGGATPTPGPSPQGGGEVRVRRRRAERAAPVDTEAAMQRDLSRESAP